MKDAFKLTKYSELVPFVNNFAKGHFTLMIIVGNPGIQKTRMVKDTLNNKKVCWIENRSSAFDLYCELYKYRNKPIVIDDVDSLYRTPDGRRLLKCLAQSEDVRRLHWGTATPLLEKEGVPKHFYTSSNTCLIFNQMPSDNLDVRAIQDRAIAIHFAPSAKEVHKRTKKWFKEQEIHEWFGNMLHYIPDPSMRNYVIAAQLKAAGMDWRELMLTKFCSEEARSRIKIVLDLLERKDLSNKKRAAEFERMGGGCPKTFYNYLARIRE